ncbi:MAG TPA: N-6 DNA methylase [Longimicrobiaceae bacterium]
MSSEAQFFTATVRPALEYLGWGAGREFQIGDEPVFGDEYGTAFACTVPESRPFVITIPRAEDPRNVLEWSGHVGYNLGSPLVLSATPHRAVVLAPHTIRRAEQPPKEPEPAYTLFEESHPAPSTAVPFVVQDTRGADLTQGLRRLSIHPNDVVAAAARNGIFRGTGYHPRAPADEALLHALISARAQVLHEEEIEGADRAAYLKLDDDLLSLIGTLVFMRGVEDRGYRAELPRDTLWGLAERENPVAALEALASALRKVYGSAALPPLRTGWQATGAIRQLIRNLYHDPARGARFDFRLLDEDILARLYEQYLQYLYVDRREAEQIRLFGREDRIQLNVRKEYGIYYTPRAVVDIVLAEVRHRLGTSSEPPSIIEPACGAGAFLRPALHWFYGEWSNTDPARLSERLVGVDVDPRAVTLTQQALARSFVELTGTAQPVEVVLCDFLEATDDGEVLCGGKPWQRWFDAAVGNPPFLAHAAGKKIDPERLERHRQIFADATSGKPNLAAYFVIQALKVLRPGGVLGMVVPRLMLRGPEYGKFRSVVLREAELLSIVDFGTNHVFEDPEITTALLFLKKRPSEQVDAPASDSRGVFTVRYRDDFAPLIAESLQGRANPIEVHGTLLEASCRARGEEPWLLLTANGCRARALLTSGAVPIGEILKSQYTTDMMSGGGQSLLLEPDGESPDAGRVRVRSEYVGRTFEIEPRLLRRALTSEHIGRFRFRSAGRELLLFYPYDQENGEPIPIEDFLPSRDGVPGAREFVNALEPTLRAIRGNRTGTAWYGPGGTRVNAPWHDRITGEAYAPTILVWRRFSRIANVTAVRADQWVPVGSMLAFSLAREYGESALRLLAFLNSSLVNWYAIMTTPKFGSGGWADRAMSTFRDLCFPESFFAADLGLVRSALEILQRADRSVSPAQIMRAERQVDDWVYAAFGFDQKLRDAIRWEVSIFIGNAAFESAEERATAGVSFETGPNMYLEAVG